jgi:hypothetical protein
MANDNFSPFVLGMLCVLEDSGQRICEYLNCDLKRNTVGCLICFRFSGIPLKLEGRPLEMVSRLFVKASLLPSVKLDLRQTMNQFSSFYSRCLAQ